jgi:cobalt transporter subunit CbtB
MTIQTTSNLAACDTEQTTSNASATYLQTASALLFGVVIIFVVGFLPTAAAHNAAHDTRHALAFPCH